MPRPASRVPFRLGWPQNGSIRDAGIETGAFRS